MANFIFLNQKRATHWEGSQLSSTESGKAQPLESQEITKAVVRHEADMRGVLVSVVLRDQTTKCLPIPHTQASILSHFKMRGLLFEEVRYSGLGVTR